MMKAETRLHLFFATQNNTAVVLVRAKRRLFRLIKWGRDEDRFEDGQWLKRQVFADQCDLAPDGSHFLFSVYDGRMNQPAGEAYTAISRPPYFTALALFPAHLSWSCGGHFLSNTLYRISGDTKSKDILGQADGLHRVVAGQVTKDCRTGLRLENGKPAPLSRELREELLDGERPPDPKLLDLYDTMNGCLWRRQGRKLELIRDFRDMEFEPIRAPYAPDHAGQGDKGRVADWHPLDRDSI